MAKVKNTKGAPDPKVILENIRKSEERNKREKSNSEDTQKNVINITIYI